MTTRATVQQAVEVLKVYQLRRENTLVSQQLQDLQTGLQELRAKHESLESDLFRTKLKQIDSVLTTLRHDQQKMEISLKGCKDDCRQESKQRDDEEAVLRKMIGDIAAQLEKSTSTCLAEPSQLLHRRIAEVEWMLNLKADAEDVTNLRSNLDTLQKNAALSLWMRRPVGHLDDAARDDVSMLASPGPASSHESQLDFSKEHHRTEIDVQGNAVVTLGKDADGHNITNGFAALIQPSGGNQADRESPDSAAIPDDIDLDETGCSVTDPNFCASGPSPASLLHPLPYSRPNLFSSVTVQSDEDASFKQGDDETLAAYLQRGMESCAKPLSGSVDSHLHQVVHGASGGMEKRILEAWLDKLGWTWQNMRNIVKLEPFKHVNTEVECQAQDPEHAKEVDSEAAEHEVLLRPRDDRPNIPNSNHDNSESPDSGLTNLSKPRRSQRIAEKSQRKETQSDAGKSLSSGKLVQSQSSSAGISKNHEVERPQAENAPTRRNSQSKRHRKRKQLFQVPMTESRKEIPGGSVNQPQEKPSTLNTKHSRPHKRLILVFPIPVAAAKGSTVSESGRDGIAMSRKTISMQKLSTSRIDYESTMGNHHNPKHATNLQGIVAEDDEPNNSAQFHQPLCSAKIVRTLTVGEFSSTEEGEDGEDEDDERFKVWL